MHVTNPTNAYTGNTKSANICTKIYFISSIYEVTTTQLSSKSFFCTMWNLTSSFILSICTYRLRFPHCRNLNARVSNTVTLNVIRESIDSTKIAPKIPMTDLEWMAKYLWSQKEFGLKREPHEIKNCATHHAETFSHGRQPLTMSCSAANRQLVEIGMSKVAFQQHLWKLDRILLSHREKCDSIPFLQTANATDINNTCLRTFTWPFWLNGQCATRHLENSASTDNFC